MNFFSFNSYVIDFGLEGGVLGLGSCGLGLEVCVLGLGGYVLVNITDYTINYNILKTYRINSYTHNHNTNAQI